MENENTTASQPMQSQAAESPMEMGTGMGKKMMGQMGRGGGPMEMMQKMMAQMSQGDGKPAMEKMMGACSDMMSSMRQTNALAVHVTPELQQAFGEWVSGLEYQALGLLAKGTADAGDIAQSLKITEGSALYLLNRLATSGKITLAGKLIS